MGQHQHQHQQQQHQQQHQQQQQQQHSHQQQQQVQQNQKQSQGGVQGGYPRTPAQLHTQPPHPQQFQPQRPRTSCRGADAAICAAAPSRDAEHISGWPSPESTANNRPWNSAGPASDFYYAGIQCAWCAGASFSTASSSECNVGASWTWTLSACPTVRRSEGLYHTSHAPLWRLFCVLFSVATKGRPPKWCECRCSRRVVSQRRRALVDLTRACYSVPEPSAAW